MPPNVFEKISMPWGPLWNSLPDHLCNPAVDSEHFRRDLKMYLVFETWAH